MSYSVRPAQAADLPRILEIFAQARQYMRSQGNPNQWGNDRPPKSTLLDDIAKQQLYVCTRAEQILGVFAYIPGPDPTYAMIEGGQWLRDTPYGVIHRIAVAEHQQGVASFCIQWAFAQCNDLRIDTHAENIPMQKALRKWGFHYCGIIYLANGDPRMAYHKIQ